MPRRLTQEERICRSISEADVQAGIIDLAQALGGRVTHFSDSRRDIGGGEMVGDEDALGYPDLTIVLPTGVWWVECKTELAKVTLEQQEWLDAINLVMPGHGIVARPSNWRDGTIETLLMRAESQEVVE